MNYTDLHTGCFYHRYDTSAELELLNQLWPLANDRLNFFTPTKKTVGYTTDRVGRRKRFYDKPTTPRIRPGIAWESRLSRNNQRFPR